jgi:hypothetical protein
MGLIVAALASGAPVEAQFMPGAVPDARPMPPPGAFGVPGSAFLPGAVQNGAPMQPPGAFGAPGSAFLPAKPAPSGYGAGPGAFVPGGGAPLEAVHPPAGDSEDPGAPDPGPVMGYQIPREPEGVPPPNWSVWAEYLLFWSQSNRLPFSTLTQGPGGAPVPGALGQAGTRVLVGTGGGYGYGLSPAFRVGLTYWIAQPEQVALDLSFFMATTETNNLTVIGHSTPGSLVLARPFLNANTGREDADPRAQPNLLAGTASQGFTTNIFGSEANIRWLAGNTETVTGGSSISFLGGVRQLMLNDQFQINDQTMQELAGGKTFNINDTFRTFNQFVGGQVGAIVRYRWDERMTSSIFGKIAGGPNFETVNVSGSTVVLNSAGATIARDGFGLYSQPSNVGKFQHTRFTVIPEVGANLAIDVNEHVRFKVGYSFVYVSDVVRPGDQMDRRVNLQPLNLAPGFLGTAQRPAPPSFTQTDFFYQFVNLGVEFSF